MKVSVAYAKNQRQIWLTVEIPENGTVQDAITLSGILNQFPEIDLTQQKIGIFGKLVTLESNLEEGDRVEIYRPLIADPKKIRGRGNNS